MLITEGSAIMLRSCLAMHCVRTYNCCRVLSVVHRWPMSCVHVKGQVYSCCLVVSLVRRWSVSCVPVEGQFYSCCLVLSVVHRWSVSCVPVEGQVYSCCLVLSVVHRWSVSCVPVEGQVYSRCLVLSVVHRWSVSELRSVPASSSSLSSANNGLPMPMGRCKIGVELTMNLSRRLQLPCRCRHLQQHKH